MARHVPSHAEVLDPIGYRIEQRRTWAWTRLEKLGDKAKSEMVRLLVLKEYVDRLDPKPRGAAEPDDGRPLNVTIVLTSNGHAGAPLQTHGVRLHLSEHNGDGA